MTSLPPRPILPVAERLAVAASAIEPILNRVVVIGPPVVSLLMTDPNIHTRDETFAADSTLQFLSTSMIDRLGVQLQAQGLSRIERTSGAERWRVPGDVAIDVMQVPTDDDALGQPWLEYATLLTLPFTTTRQLAVRIAGAPAMLALEFDAFARSRGRAIESEELERVVCLVAGRAEIERECAAAPPELRAFVVPALARLVRDDALDIMMRRALPDAALVPALLRRVRERIVRMTG